MFLKQPSKLKGLAQALVFALMVGMLTLIPTNSDRAEAAPSDLISSVGQEFWITFNGQTGTNLNIYISSKTDTIAKVTWPDGTSQSYSVSAGLVTTVDANAKMLGKINQGLETTALNSAKITAPDPITVYTINYRQYTTDASNAIPTEALGKKYYAVSYRPNYTSNTERSRFSIIAAEAGTTSVTITPKVNLYGNRTAGTPYTITLQQGQVYSNIPTTGTDDTSGTYIEADKKIAVSTATYLSSYITAGTSQANDNIFEQMTPVESWGKNFIGAMSIATTGADLYRIIAAENGTTVTVNDTTNYSLDAGQLIEFAASTSGVKADRISSSKPIMVLQYLRGGAGYVDPASSSNTATGDPAFFVVPPTSQFINDYIITTPASGFNVNAAVIVAPKTVKNTLTKGGIPLGASAFTDIPSSSYAIARVSLTLGAHYFRAAEPFSIAVMGFTSYDSYAYTGGYGLVQTDGGYVAAQSSQSPTAPFSVGGDSIAGNPGPCGTLSISEGSWTDGRSTITGTSYQWLKDGVDVSGATSATLSLDASYVGSVVSARVTKTNGVGQTSAFTNQMEILDTRIQSLSLSAGVLSPSLTGCGSSYVVATSDTSFSFSPTLQAAAARVKINGASVLSRGWSNTYNLNPGANNFEFVTSNGSASHTVSITVNRTANPIALTTVPQIGINSATLSGIVQPNNNSITSVEFELDSSNSFSSPQILAGTPGSVSSASASASARAIASGLTAGAKYFYRMKISDGTNVFRSDVYEFTTLAAPSVETVEFTKSTSTSAVAKMNIYPQSQPVVRAEFQISEDSNMLSGVSTVSGVIDNGVSLSNGGVRYNYTFTGLTPGKTYYVRAVGENTTGENFGAKLSATVTSTPDITATASVVARTITLRGTVDPNAVQTSNVYFQYGTSSLLSGATSVTAVPSVISGDGARDVEVQVSGLSASTTYYYRLVAVNSLGTTTGVIQSISTQTASTPTVEILGPSNVNTTDTIFVAFRFSEAVTGFDKSKVSLTGSSSGWVTQPTTQISSQLYSMEIRPTNPATGSFNINVAAGAGVSQAAVNSSQPSPLTVTVTNLPATTFSYPVSTLSLVAGQAMQSLTPTWSGTAPTSWGVSPTLPNGMSINSLGEISGTPSAGQNTTSYIVTAIGGVGTPIFTLQIFIQGTVQSSSSNSQSGAVGNQNSSSRDGKTLEISHFSSRTVFDRKATFAFYGSLLSNLSYAKLGGVPLEILANSADQVVVRADSLPLGKWDLEIRNSNGTLTFVSAITVLKSPAGRVVASAWVSGQNSFRNTLMWQRLQSNGRLITTVVCYANSLPVASASSRFNALERAKSSCAEMLEFMPGSKAHVREKAVKNNRVSGKVSLQFWTK